MRRVLLAVTIIFVTESAVAAANQFDGNWKIDVDGATKKCATPPFWRYNIKIVEGDLQSAEPDPNTRIVGSVDNDGKVRASVKRGGNSATGSGKLSVNSGNGGWKSTGARKCSGTWRATKQ